MSLSKSKVNHALQSRGGFAIVPNELWRLDIPPQAKMIWAYLLSQHPEWLCSRNNIARNLKLGRKSVTDMLKILGDHKMIDVRPGKKGTWHIEMLPPDSWSVPELIQEVDAIEDMALADEQVPSIENIEDNKCILKDTNTLNNTKTGSNQNRSRLEPVSVDTTSNTRIEEKEKILAGKQTDHPSIEDVYRKWLAEIPERADFKACYEELCVLFESLKVSNFKIDDLTPSFKKKILKRWEKSKYPDKHIAWLDRAAGTIFCADIKLSVPEVKNITGVKIKRNDGQISIDTAIAMTTDDDVIQQMMREYEEIRTRSPLPESFDDE